MSISDKLEQDIKALQEQVQALKKQVDLEKETLLALTEVATDGVWDWHLISNYEYMSPRFWEIFGYDHSTKKHDPSEWMAMIHPDDLKVAQDNVAQHIASKGKIPYYQEVRYRHKDGHVVWVICRGKVIQWDADENALRMVGTHTDITDMKGPKQKADW